MQNLKGNPYKVQPPVLSFYLLGVVGVVATVALCLSGIASEGERGTHACTITLDVFRRRERVCHIAVELLDCEGSHPRWVACALRQLCSDTM